MYCALCTRPDIAFVVGVLSRNLSDPKQEHFDASIRVLRYIETENMVADALTKS